jgi:hypothetical protein
MEKPMEALRHWVLPGKVGAKRRLPYRRQVTKKWLLRTEVIHTSGTDRGLSGSFGMKIRGKHLTTALSAIAVGALLAASATAIHEPIRSVGIKPAYPVDEKPVRVVGTPFVPNVNPRER